MVSFGISPALSATVREPCEGGIRAYGKHVSFGFGIPAGIFVRRLKISGGLGGIKKRGGGRSKEISPRRVACWLRFCPKRAAKRRIQLVGAFAIRRWTTQPFRDGSPLCVLVEEPSTCGSFLCRYFVKLSVREGLQIGQGSSTRGGKYTRSTFRFWEPPQSGPHFRIAFL